MKVIKNVKAVQQKKSATPSTNKEEDGTLINGSSKKKVVHTLPRTLETAARRTMNVKHVLGIDEAGRGPLAGPVVVAAAWIDPSAPLIEGIVDSKRITAESDREILYEQIVASTQIQWAVGVIDAAKIDAINILQATLLGMRLVAETLIDKSSLRVSSEGDDCKEKYPIQSKACISHSGCYLISNRQDSKSSQRAAKSSAEQFHVLIDGNRVPDNMPCSSEAIVKGDGREYCIAAASILAKVTRDRLMNAYDEKYPVYGLKQHKGYPTAAHRQAVMEHGASPIHRLTFAPLKNMKLDPVTGRILE